MKFKIRNLFVILCMLGSGALLLHTSQKVQLAESQVKDLQQNIAQEEDTIKVLRTEWAFLNNPERLEMLAKTYLNVDAVTPDQLAVNAGDYFPNAQVDVAVKEVPVVTPVSYEPTKMAFAAQAVSASHVNAAPHPQKNFNALLQRVAAGSGQ